jgi:hypothetical protein
MNEKLVCVLVLDFLDITGTRPQHHVQTAHIFRHILFRADTSHINNQG